MLWWSNMCDYSVLFSCASAVQRLYHPVCLPVTHLSKKGFHLLLFSQSFWIVHDTLLIYNIRQDFKAYKSECGTFILSFIFFCWASKIVFVGPGLNSKQYWIKSTAHLLDVTAFITKPLCCTYDVKVTQFIERHSRPSVYYTLSSYYNSWCICSLEPPSLDSLQYFLRVASVRAFFVRCPEAARLQQGVWPTVEHHGWSCCGNDSHCITHSGLNVVVPFVIWDWDKPWERECERQHEVRKRDM